jgi:hypothetical protein
VLWEPPEQSKKLKVKASPRDALFSSLFGAVLKAIKGTFPMKITGLQATLLKNKN